MWLRPGVAPEDPEAEHREDVGAGVEEAVPQGVHLQVLHAVGRVTGAREQVVPLQDLMQHDAVEEAAEPQPEQDPCRGREAATDSSIPTHGNLQDE